MLKKLEPNQFDQFYHLLEISFPVDERRPYQELKRILSNPLHEILVIPDEETNEIKAGIAVWKLSSFLFLEHFAVNPVCRSQGLGSQILKELTASFPGTICLEVELPDTELARRRIGFYERNHFYYNDYPYMMPPLAAGQNSMPLRIMTSGSTITPEAFETIKDLLYTEVYEAKDFKIQPQFRKAEAQDLAAIAAIYEEIHTQEEAGLVTIGWARDVYPTLATAEASLARGDLFVEEIAGKIVAAAIINQVQVPVYAEARWEYPARDEEVMVLHTLTVSPSYSGKGYGKAFVSFYEQYALEHNCSYLRMDTNARNANARRLYQALGYKEVDIVPCEFNGIPGVQLVCLEKKL